MRALEQYDTIPGNGLLVQFELRPKWSGMVACARELAEKQGERGVDFYNRCFQIGKVVYSAIDGETAGVELQGAGFIPSNAYRYGDPLVVKVRLTRNSLLVIGFEPGKELGRDYVNELLFLGAAAMMSAGGKKDVVVFRRDKEPIRVTWIN